MCPMGGARQSAGPPRRGDLMRDFALSSARGERIALAQYRGRNNLVVLFAGREKLPLLSKLALRQDAITAEDARVLVIAAVDVHGATALQHGAPFLVLADPDAQLHRSMGAFKDDAPVPALYITDRFGEVFAAFRTGAGQSLPDADDVLDWLGFVNRQCEECFPPEWPAVG